MKAYCARRKGEFCATLVFAETRGKAKSTAMFTDCCGGADFLDIEVCRLPRMDKYYKPGKTEMDWFDPQDRIALVKDGGFTCEYIELPECEECSAQEYCEKYQNYKEEADSK